MNDKISRTTFFLTEMKEDYLRAIYVLEEKTKQLPRVSNIAEYLKQKKSTVSEALKSLHEQELVIREPYKPIMLTSKGLFLAKRLTLKHRLIEVFLHNVLGISKDRIHQEAHKLEHATSDLFSSKLHSFLTDIDASIKKLEELKQVEVLTCPHGRPLPSLIDDSTKNKKKHIDPENY